MAALDIQPFLPDSYRGSIIITTRSAQLQFGQTMEVRKLEHIWESLEILSNVSKRTGLSEGERKLCTILQPL